MEQDTQSWNRKESEQCVAANINRPGTLSNNERIANILGHFETVIKSLLLSERKKVLNEVAKNPVSSEHCENILVIPLSRVTSLINPSSE